MFSRLDTVL